MPSWSAVVGCFLPLWQQSALSAVTADEYDGHDHGNWAVDDHARSTEGKTLPGSMKGCNFNFVFKLGLKLSLMLYTSA